MIEIKSPQLLQWREPLSIFLGGSIEMGKATDWQADIKKALAEFDVALLNPRREQWDSTWVQSIENPEFHEQVTWELNGIERADIVLFYFDPNTTSPITLMELGLCAGRGQRTIVCCPHGYYRKGNVDIVCARFGVTLVETYDDLMITLISHIKRSL